VIVRRIFVMKSLMFGCFDYRENQSDLEYYVYCLLVVGSKHTVH
jgi:hypothetical protein